jgi:hypothetical protein
MPKAITKLPVHIFEARSTHGGKSCDKKNISVCRASAINMQTRKSSKAAYRESAPESFDQEPTASATRNFAINMRGSHTAHKKEAQAT